MLDRATIERLDLVSANALVLVALSGGGDSVALLHLLKDHYGATRLRAAVVDHALREGSADDAQRAAGFAEALGVAVNVLTLAWPDGPNRAQAAARDARYAALCNEARRVGAIAIAVAHSADDQAETVLMRAAGGSAWRGLAGIAPFAPAPIWPEGRGVWLARPLFSARRADLRTLLRDRNAEWIDDPANANAAYERVRIRARLAELEASGFHPLRLTRLAANLRTHADKLDADAAELIVRAAKIEADIITLDPAHWVGARDTRRRALSVLITAAAGAEREPAANAIEQLEARLAEANFRGGTLGGATLARTGEGLRLSRDAGALIGRADGAKALPPLPLPVDGETVWDGRVALTAMEPGWNVHADTGAPTLVKRDMRVSLQEAVAARTIVAHWLLTAHVRHLLGRTD
jgi:tRNA(Ile)-lysidine synthase